jgi:hypothetical protein
MKITRRELGKVTGAAMLAPMVAQSQTTAQAPDTAKRDWLAEAREAHGAAARAVERVEVPTDVEPAFQFRA